MRVDNSPPGVLRAFFHGNWINLEFHLVSAICFLVQAVDTCGKPPNTLSVKGKTDQIEVLAVNPLVHFITSYVFAAIDLLILLRIYAYDELLGLVVSEVQVHHRWVVHSCQEVWFLQVVKEQTHITVKL